MSQAVTWAAAATGIALGGRWDIDMGGRAMPLVRHLSRVRQDDVLSTGPAVWLLSARDWLADAMMTASNSQLIWSGVGR